MATHPPGLIAILSADMGRYRDFDASLTELVKPDGTRIFWVRGVNIAANLNNGCRMLMGMKSLQWLWVLGDDHVFDSGLLIRLLERQVDCVTPLVLRRGYPWQTVVHGSEAEKYRRIPLEAFDGRTGLVDISQWTVGNAGQLLRRRVIEITDGGDEHPWFEVGRTYPETGGQDLWFCEKMRKAGISSWLDLDNTMGHVASCSVWPRREGGRWTGEAVLPHISGTAGIQLLQPDIPQRIRPTNQRPERPRVGPAHQLQECTA